MEVREQEQGAANCEISSKEVCPGVARVSETQDLTITPTSLPIMNEVETESVPLIKEWTSFKNGEVIRISLKNPGD